jgi:hypothetical protein
VRAAVSPRSGGARTTWFGTKRRIVPLTHAPRSNARGFHNSRSPRAPRPNARGFHSNRRSHAPRLNARGFHNSRNSRAPRMSVRHYHNICMTYRSLLSIAIPNLTAEGHYPLYRALVKRSAISTGKIRWVIRPVVLPHGCRVSGGPNSQTEFRNPSGKGKKF